MRLNESEIFLEPAGNGLGLTDNEQIQILYSPLTEGIALVQKDDAVRIAAYCQNPAETDDKEIADLIGEMTPDRIPSPHSSGTLHDITKLSILPNLTCNFTCSYCYSAKGRSRTVIEWKKVKAVLDFFIDEKRIQPQPLSIFISGGGEPLMSWDIVYKTLQYARLRATEKGFPLYMSIVTNGSLLTEAIAAEIKKYGCSVCISYEILPELQDAQRKHYERVKENILMLGRMGVRTMLNSTITPLSVSRMKEMICEAINTYPFVSQYTMEPVTGAGIFSSSEALHRFYDDFYNGYIACKQIAEQQGFNLRFTFDDSLRGITVRHCPGKFALTPQGTISACHLTSSPKEDRYSRCVYGQVNDDGKLELDSGKFDQLKAINVFSYERCRDCFAKWSCGGECLARNDTYPESYMKEVCAFNRKFVKHLLLEEIRKAIMEENGISLEEYVRTEF